MNLPARLAPALALLALGACQCGADDELGVLVRVLTADRTTVDVGSAFVGGRTSTTVTLSAEGNAPVALAEPQVSGPFVVTGVPGGVPVDDSVTVDVVFTAVAVGAAAGSVVFDSDADNAPLVLSLLAEGLAPLDCDDGNDCTSDIFDPSDGTCTSLQRQGDCDDDDACTTADRCSEGRCVGDRVDCSDGIACTLDTCVADVGCTFVPDDSACADDDPCTLDLCETDGFGEGCTHPPAPEFTPCGGLEQCVTVDLCIQGFCAPVAITDNAPCTDFNVCTAGDVCSGGACIGVAVEQPPIVVGESHVFGPLSPAHPWSDLPPTALVVRGRTYLSGAALTEVSPRLHVHHELGPLTQAVALDDTRFVAVQHIEVDSADDAVFDGLVNLVIVEVDADGALTIVARAPFARPPTLPPLVDALGIAVCRDTGSGARFALFDTALAPLGEGAACEGAVGGGRAPSGDGVTVVPSGALLHVLAGNNALSHVVVPPEGCSTLVAFDGAFIAMQCGTDAVFVPAFTESAPLRLPNTTPRLLLRLADASLLVTTTAGLETTVLVDDGSAVHVDDAGLRPSNDPPPAFTHLIGIATDDDAQLFTMAPGSIVQHRTLRRQLAAQVPLPFVGTWVEGQALPDGQIFTHAPTGTGVVDASAGFDVVPVTLASFADRPRVFRLGDDVVGVQPQVGDLSPVGRVTFSGSLNVCSPACPSGDQRIVRGSSIDAVDIETGETRSLAIVRSDGDPDRSVLISPVLDGCEGVALDWRPTDGSQTEGALFAVHLDGCDGGDVAFRVDVVDNVVNSVNEGAAFTWRASLTDGTAIAYGARAPGLVEVRFFESRPIAPVVDENSGTLVDLRHDGEHLVTIISTFSGTTHTLHAEGPGVDVDFVLPGSARGTDTRVADSIRRRILAVAWPIVFVSDFAGDVPFVGHRVIVFDAERGGAQATFEVPSEPVAAIVREDRGDVVVVRNDGTTTISPPCGRVP
jgi:hypothetical protein